MIPTKNIKVVILGDSGVGKSSIMTRFITGTFQEDSEPTLGGAFMAKAYTYKATNIKFQIWDTAGQEKYHSLAPMYYRDSQVAILVYDITKRGTFDALRKWVDELKNNGPKDLLTVVVGNKIDLFNQEQITTEESALYAKEIGAFVKHTSAKEDRGVQDLFDRICEEIIRREIKEEEAERLKVEKAKKKEKEKCC